MVRRKAYEECIEMKAKRDQGRSEEYGIND